MDSVKALLRLEFKSRLGSFSFRDIKGILKTLVVLAFFALVYVVYIYGAKNFLISFYIYDMQYLFLVFFITVAETVMFFAGIGTISKTLFSSGDNEILMRFPVKGSEVFISKILFTLIVQSVVTLIIMLPVFIIYGNLIRAGLLFYITMSIVLLLCIVFPFLLSNILAIPFMYLKAFLKDKYALILIIFIALVAGGFAAYMVSIQNVMAFMEEESMDFFSSSFMVILTKIASYTVPFRQFANLMVNREAGWSTAIVLVTILSLAELAYIVVRKMYIITMFKNIEIEGSSFTKVTKNKPKKIFFALIRREFLEIFRSSNYSFQYLSMAFGAPIMVYFCNKLALFVGETNVGNGILPALTLLVMLIFISIIVSFSSTSVSREGDCFYITKIVPVPFRVQVIVKFVLYIIVALASVILSIGVLVISGYADMNRALLMLGICVLFAIGETCLSIKLDIVKPSFAVGGEGELTEGTASAFLSMVTGLMIAAITGVAGMVTSYFYDVNYVLLIILAASGGFALLTAFWLFFRLESSYSRIMQR